jgi:hypothetical protein
MYFLAAGLLITATVVSLFFAFNCVMALKLPVANALILSLYCGGAPIVSSLLFLWARRPPEAFVSAIFTTAAVIYFVSLDSGVMCKSIYSVISIAVYAGVACLLSSVSSVVAVEIYGRWKATHSSDSHG